MNAQKKPYLEYNIEQLDKTKRLPSQKAQKLFQVVVGQGAQLAE